jgi:L-ascorbate metabolism protein UlaG (beta-lactamase superfamily)
LRLKGIPSFHDDSEGAERRSTIRYTFVIEEVMIAHLGDLGEPFDDTQREALAEVDVLPIPVGGHFAIDAKQAGSIIEGPPNVRLVVPMHFRTDRITGWPIAPVEDFESLMDNVRRIAASTVEVTRASLPTQREV